MWHNPIWTWGSADAEQAAHCIRLTGTDPSWDTLCPNRKRIASDCLRVRPFWCMSLAETWSTWRQTINHWNQSSQNHWLQLPSAYNRCSCACRSIICRSGTRKENKCFWLIHWVMSTCWRGMPPSFQESWKALTTVFVSQWLMTIGNSWRMQLLMI